MQNILEQLRTCFEKRAGEYHVRFAFLYGSHVHGMPRSDSDVDIAVVFDGTIATDDDAYKIISQMSLDIEALLKRDVNIISIDVESWKPMFYYNVIVCGKPLYIKDKALYDSFRWQAIQQMEDFRLFGIAWQMQAARQNLRRI